MPSPGIFPEPGTQSLIGFAWSGHTMNIISCLKDALVFLSLSGDRPVMGLSAIPASLLEADSTGGSRDGDAQHGAQKEKIAQRA